MGALGARAPRAEKKLGGANLQGKVVSAPPGRACITGRPKVQFLGNWRYLGGGSG